ncbi:unnamed protein product [Periconia digitata]|uniref:Uncharacterized protein n=1 Tax=Periconia digitata TaxID=1303443 RepID=A0A9W4ULW0_9PLEO|nr:unnamed protein product [Periconia digitata]
MAKRSTRQAIDDRRQFQPLKSQTSATNSSIGWQTPTIMSVTYLVAVIFALAHYLYCRAIDRKLVQDSIPQSWNSVLSVLFAQGYSIHLAASGSQAFTQIMWWYLRRRSLSVSKIDALFHLNASPIYLWRVDLLAITPALWFFALFFPLIAVATAFPPASLVLQQLPKQDTSMGQVPMLDVMDLGNGTLDDMYRNAMFSTSSKGFWETLPIYSSLGKRTFLQGEIITKSSPCGSNCSYELQLVGPTLACKDSWPYGEWKRVRADDTIAYNETNDDLLPLLLRQTEDGDYTYWGMFSSFRYERSLSDEERELIPIPSRDGWNSSQWEELGLENSDSSKVFDIFYRTDRSKMGQTIGCVLANSTYDVKFNYTDKVQTVDVRTSSRNTANRYNENIRDIIQNQTRARQEFPDEIDRLNEDLRRSFGLWQLYAMFATFMMNLSGAVENFNDKATTDGMVNRIKTSHGNNNILDSPFVSSSWNSSTHTENEIEYNISPSVIEELMINYTISVLNHSNKLKEVEITRITYQDGWVFKAPNQLLIAYFTGLALYFVVISLGFLALIQNGTPASPGGFLEVLTAVAASEQKSTMNKRVRAYNVGERAPRELMDYKIRLGEVRDEFSGTCIAAFGAPEETMPLRKRPFRGLDVSRE